MNRDQYLAELSGYLNSIPVEEKQQAMEYYREYTEELENNNEDITAKLGTPRQVADAIINDSSAGRAWTGNAPKKKMNGCLIAVLVILAIPIGFPLAIAALAIGLAAVIVIVTVPLSLVIATFAVAIGGFVAFIASIAMWFISPAGGMAATGTGLFMIGFAMLFGLAVIKLCELCVRLINFIFDKLFCRNKNKGEV